MLYHRAQQRQPLSVTAMNEPDRTAFYLAALVVP